MNIVQIFKVANKVVYCHGQSLNTFELEGVTQNLTYAKVPPGIFAVGAVMLSCEEMRCLEQL